MALIKCPECSKEISDKAKSCPNCGCPLEEITTSGIVRIKMPNDIVVGLAGLFASRDAIVKDSNGNILWSGKHGDNASFNIDGPTDIVIELGGLASQTVGTVEAKRKYCLVEDKGVHWVATYRLSEVDIIDSD
ncbi:MAG: zinc ribbon domain-containing protein [Lacrimispora sp.]